MLAQVTSETEFMPVPALGTSTGLAEPSERRTRASENTTALGEMTRGIAHDFRNVLCMLTSGLSIAEANADNPEKLRLALDAMHEGVARGLKITNRLLAFARQQELGPSEEDINILLTALNTFLRYGAGPDIRVALQLAPSLPKCLVDPPQLNAAILNLVVNARDAMPDGGTIRISTIVAAREFDGGRRDYVRLRVRDNGMGMPANVMARIFDPFFTTKGDSGTGLGVPQVQAMMRQAGGHVRVHSRPGKGTAFDLYFPVLNGTAVAVNADCEQLEQWTDEGGAIGPSPAWCLRT
jgi:signal transduction histidine kinase